jgi:hypothetical protein
VPDGGGPEASRMSGVSRIRGRAAVAAAVVAGVAVAACASSSQQVRAAAQRSSATATGTVVLETFSPYAATGTLAVPVADQRAGSCWTGSIAVAAPGAYRCLAGNQIEDPCFADTTQPHPRTVACVTDPWSPAHVITLTEPLPAATAAGPSRTPWAIELSNGARCEAVTGTVPSVNGVAFSYQCGASMVAGIIGNDGAHILVDYGAREATTFTHVAVTRAWRG